jgi:hypothetical protein
MGYEGNCFRKYRSSVIASHKKILFETPCPGRNLPEDTYCFDLSIVTGLGKLQARESSNRAVITGVIKNRSSRNVHQ